MEILAILALHSQKMHLGLRPRDTKPIAVGQYRKLEIRPHFGVLDL